jgi:hypothetical protein
MWTRLAFWIGVKNFRFGPGKSGAPGCIILMYVYSILKHLRILEANNYHWDRSKLICFLKITTTSIWCYGFTLRQSCKFCAWEFWFNHKLCVSWWVSIITRKFKSHRNLIFIVEGWNTDISVADIVSAFEATWTCHIGLNLSIIIFYPFMTHIRKDGSRPSCFSDNNQRIG